MAKLFFSLKLWSAKSSIPVMTMLAEQAETNIIRALSDADLPDAIKEDMYEDEHVDEEGNVYPYTQPYFTCGSCAGLDADDVRDEYKHLISQLTRRSAFLTMFGLFEHRMVGCLDVMDYLSGKVTTKTFKTVEDCHKRLIGTIGGKGIKDIDHLAVIRNIMAHNDGVADLYHELLKVNTERTTDQKRRMRGIKRAINENAGIKVNQFNGVLMDSRFLTYVAGEFERYVGELEAAVLRYRE